MLFYTAANATSEEGLTQKLVDGVKSHRELGEAGWINEWNAAGGSGGRKRIRQEIVRHGGECFLSLGVFSLMLCARMGWELIALCRSQSACNLFVGGEGGVGFV